MVYILGGEYPLTIVMPFILIIAGLVFFLTVYIKDNVGKIKIFSKKHRHEEKKKEIINFNKEYLSLKRGTANLTASDSLDAITDVTKKFIANLLNMDRQFSFEELPRDKLDWPVIELTKRLSDLKYSGREITKSEINHLMLYLSKVLKIKPEKEVKEEKHFFPRLIRFPKIEFKFPRIKHKHHEEVKPHKEIKPLDLGLPRKITFDLTWLLKRKEHHEEVHKIDVKPEKHVIEIKTPEPEHKKIKHHKKHGISLFERIRISSQSSKILKLIKKAERISLNNPIVSKKIFDEALMMYYRLPINIEENIAIRLNKFYEKINGKQEKEIINIKHNDLKSTKEAFKHMERYRNYVIIENNNINNNVRNSFNNLKKQTVNHLSKEQDKKTKLKLMDFLRAVSKEENNIFSLEEAAFERLLDSSASLLKSISQKESSELYNTQKSIENFFSSMKMSHRLPKVPSPVFNNHELKNEILKIKEPLLDEIKQEIPKHEIKLEQPREIKIRPPEPKIVPRKKVIIEPPKLHEKRISERMKKLLEEKESIYNKLKDLEERELDRFRQTKRMTLHENIGYHDFIKNLKPREELDNDHKIKKILEAK